jgi:O-antigen/teichoic acid export membrane protein
MAIAAARFQGELRFGLSLDRAEPNLVLIVAALLVLLVGSQGAGLAVGVSTAGFVVAAWFGWAILLRERHAKPERACEIAWGEAFAFAGVNASGLLLVQMDRLIIPHVRPVADLATFGVWRQSWARCSVSCSGGLLAPAAARAAGGGKVPAPAHEGQLVGVIVLLGSAFIWWSRRRSSATCWPNATSLRG